MMQLTEENYHSSRANQHYMSCSQYQDFIQCESMAMAKIYGWTEDDSLEMTIGSYVHAWNEGRLKLFQEDHPEIFTKNGELRAPYEQANSMIETLQSDPKAMAALSGDKEVIMTGHMFGTHWKIKVDSYNPIGGWLSDLKTARNLHETVYSPGLGGRRSFIEAYGYIAKMAVYVEIERINTERTNWLDQYLVIVTKEDPPDKAIITFSEARIQEQLDLIAEKMPRILSVKNGLEKPISCGKCCYCRKVKKIERVFDYDEFLQM